MHHTTSSRSPHNALHSPSFYCIVKCDVQVRTITRVTSITSNESPGRISCNKKKRAAYGQYARDLKARADLDTFIVQLFGLELFSIFSEHKYFEYEAQGER